MSYIELPPMLNGFSFGMVMMALSSFLVLVHRMFFRKGPLDDIPGPFLARWTHVWLAYQVRMGRRYLVVDALHKKYGPLVRISPNHVSAAHPDAINVVYGQGAGAFDKSPYYHAFITNKKTSVFSTVDRQEHSQKRRIVSQAFSYRSLLGVTPIIHHNLENFIEKIDEMCDTGIYVDALQWLNYLTFDVLSDLAFGQPIGMVSSGSDRVSVLRADGTESGLTERAIELVNEREHLAAVIGIHPSFRLLTKLLPDPFFIHAHKSTTSLIDLARKRVTKRISSGSSRDDILNKLITAREKETGTLTPEQINELIAETVTLLTAGSDTTSNSIVAIIHLVMTHPRVHEKLMKELEETIGHDDLPKHENVKNLPYLAIVIDEGLRHYAMTAIGLHRSVPAGGVVCCGTYFPEGTEMSVPAYTIQHDEAIWGDPESFRPERWLEEKNLSRYLLAFGKGPRQCMGRNLAYMEMQLILATILLRYNIELKSNYLATVEGFMHKPLGMLVKFSRRFPASA